jgi:heme exporter protein D
MNTRPTHRGQRGATLIVALIMLVALALLAVSAVNTSTTNLRVVGNTQSRQEALAAAQAAVELTISTPLFITSAAAVAAAPIPVDVDGNGAADYEARLSPKPACYRVRVLKINELDPNSSADLACLGSGAAHTAGIEVAGAAPVTGDSLCADSDWNIRAVVADARSSASVAVNQGISVRSLSTDTDNACP